MKTDILMSGSTIKNHISSKNGIRIQCNTENFVPIVVPSLSSSSSSSSHSTTPMTPSRQERNHPTSSSSSSTSPTTTVLSDSETREREDEMIPIVAQANQKRNHDSTERPVVLRHPGVAARIQRNFGG